jgi:hypothetical protein
MRVKPTIAVGFLAFIDQLSCDSANSVEAAVGVVAIDIATNHNVASWLDGKLAEASLGGRGPLSR